MGVNEAAAKHRVKNTDRSLSAAMQGMIFRAVVSSISLSARIASTEMKSML